MNYTFKRLCWMSSWMLLCSWVVSAEDIDASSSTSPTNSSAPVGLRGYRRYFANDSFIGRPVPCTRDDKICFRHNLVFNPEEERCGAFGDFIISCRYEVNLTEFHHGSGRVIASCAESADPCTGYRMAYDGVCYEKEIVDGVICGREAALTFHPFGNLECREAPAIPITVQQPDKSGSCMIPDLRFPDRERGVFFNSSFTAIQGFKNNDPVNSLDPYVFGGATDQVSCFSEGKVFVQRYEGCHTLLERGPCAEDHVVALDIQAATQGQAEGTCVHMRGGCPKGYKRMLFDGKCHEDREIAIEAPGQIILNQFGSNIVIPHQVNLRFLPVSTNDTCRINVLNFNNDVESTTLKLPCDFDDMGACNRHEVINEPPQPEL